jgi:hypothetical protein
VYTALMCPEDSWAEKVVEVAAQEVGGKRLWESVGGRVGGLGYIVAGGGASGLQELRGEW